MLPKKSIFQRLSGFEKGLLLLLIFSFITILAYYVPYGYYVKMVVYHILVVLLGITIIVSTGFAMSLSRDRKHLFKYAYSIFWASFILMLTMGYLLAFSGQIISGTPITFSMFTAYLKQFGVAKGALGINPVLAYTGIGLLPFIIFSLFLYNSLKLWNGMIAARNRWKIFVLDRYVAYKPNVKKKILLSGFLLFILIIYKFSLNPLSSPFSFYREPIYLVYMNDQIYGFSFSQKLEPAEIRKNYPKKAIFEKKNIILIIVDALRADYLPMYGYAENNTPFLSGLYSSGLLRRVDYPFSNSSLSYPGILSILRSKSWVNMARNNFSLQDLLKDCGYRTNFILAGDHTNFFDLKYNYGKSVDFYFDGFSSSHYLNDDLLIYEGLNKIPVYNKTPNFFYFHLMSVHLLGQRHSKYVTYVPANGIDLQAKTYRNNYKNGIVQADAYIKRIFDELTRKGYLKNSIVVITADHGESLGEDGFFRHANSVSNREIFIPLLIYDQDTSIKYRTDHAIQQDVAATIVDRLGLPVPGSWEGESLLQKSQRSFSYHFYRNTYAIIQYKDGGLLKYYYDKQTGKEGFFDIKADLKEKRNLMAQLDTNSVKIFRAKMKDFVKSTEK